MPEVYLEKLSAFSRLLRAEGLAATPAENQDAAEILVHLGFENRSYVKTALSCIYAKSREEQLIFDKVFDGFFISEEQMRQLAKEAMEQKAQEEANRQQAQEEFEQVGLSDSQLDTYASMSQESRDKLRRFMDRFKNNAERNPDLYSNFIHSVFAKTILEEHMKMEDAGAGVQAADPELGLMFRDISQFRDVEIPKAISIIQGICTQINGELSAKRKGGINQGKLDFRKTIRKGLETGGSLYRLKYKRKRSKKKHLVLLCDVSGSMMQFSEFALRFIQPLNQISNSARVFLFSEDIFEADPFHLQNMDLFRSYVRDCGVYGKGTDLGHAIQSLCEKRPPILNGATTLLILSDTKTIDQPRAIASLLEATRQSGRVLWLNPIPQQHWPHIRSVQAFASHCQMISCSTLNALASACRRLTLT